MKKGTWIVLCIAFLLGGFLYFLGSMQDSAPTPLSVLESRLPQKAKPSRDTREPEEVQNEMTQDNESLAEIREISISVVEADVRLKSGENWAVDYKLAEGGETLEVYEIRGKTDMVFKSKPSWDFVGFSAGGGYVEITIPEGVYLRDIEIDTVSGDITVENLGDVEEISLNSVSGDCKITGTVADSVDVETVSGDINVESATSYEIEATSAGDMEINGENPKFRYESNRDGLPELDVTSVSGDIKIKTEQDR